LQVTKAGMKIAPQPALLEQTLTVDELEVRQVFLRPTLSESN